MERNMCPLSDWMVCPSPGCVNSEVKLSGHSHFPSSPRIIAVISIALIGLIQTEERCRGRGRCRAKTDPGRDNRFFDTPGASVGCCLRQIRDRKTKSYHGFYLLSQISQKLSRGNNLSITCHSVTGCPIIQLLVTSGHSVLYWLVLSKTLSLGAQYWPQPLTDVRTRHITHVVTVHYIGGLQQQTSEWGASLLVTPCWWAGDSCQDGDGECPDPDTDHNTNRPTLYYDQ